MSATLIGAADWKKGVVMDRKPKVIGLLDHMGWGNMGDAAVQDSFIINIRKRLPEARFIGFSLYPEDTRRRHNIVSYPIRWWYPEWKAGEHPSSNASEGKSRLRSRLRRWRTLYALAKTIHDSGRELAHLMRSYKVLKSLDLLIISGGGQLSELHGDLTYNVFKFCALAKLGNKAVYVVGVGAELLKKPWNKFFTRWTIRLSDHASFRSNESQAVVRRLGAKKQTYVCPDPAYALNVPEYVISKTSREFGRSEALELLRGLGVEAENHIELCPFRSDREQEEHTAALSGSTTAKVGLNPMGFCDPRRWPRKDSKAYAEYLDKLAELSVWLLTHGYGLEIFTSDILTDLFAIEDLKKRLLHRAEAALVSQVVFRPLPVLKDLLVQMSTFDFVITSKFHGVIFSHLLMKPVIALSYSAKIDHLMRAVGHDRYCLKIEQFDVETLIGVFKSLVDEKDRLRALFAEISAEYAERVRAHFDDLFGPETRQETHLAGSGLAGTASRL